MTRIKTNFRGLRALVLHHKGATTERLAGILQRLGLVVQTCDPAEIDATVLPECDLVLFDADEEIAATVLEDLAATRPMIALIANEAPSRLARVVRFRCNSHILKPIRSMGVYSALLLATNGHEQQLQTCREIASLRQRLSGRRTVMKAVLKQMDLTGVDEDTAYEGLRRRAMELRVPIETVARMTLDLSDTEALPSHRRPRKA
ncbi:ANTAR domain-containing protein [Aestuariivita sp.]|jgi:AmiR/NasT family two-component response regulator|uniref:ANTAR domain-containing response regulator n=1 Tax=Aestuariivita sp. TaxID=1872407 RepID=UPI00217335AE|nr:ANTAR domain-containing protein [Aestuariivita sp.]MCE8009090.1 ANTAR domain-containing protein [Aestuariivita sp.]